MSESRDHIAQLAQIPARVGLTPARLIDRLHDPETTLDSIYQRLATAPQTWIEAARGVEWLLDNHYIVRRAIRLLQEEFPPAFERRLPQFDDAEPERWGLPRAYVLASELVRGLDWQIDLTSITVQLDTFQTIAALTIAELWAFPVLLRLVVLERLAAAAVLVVQPETPSPDAGGDVPQREEVVPPEQIVARCIRSLHLLETTDWSAFVERVSVVERILRSESAGVYADMDFKTRDRYRRAVEEIAIRSPRSESEVATAAVERAHAADSERQRHVGYFLIDKGRPGLEAAIGCRIEWRRRCRRWVDQRAAPLFVGTITVIALLCEYLLGAALRTAGATSAIIAIGVLLGIVPAVTIAISILNALLTRVLAPCVLPKLDFDEGLPPACRTLVAVPALLTDTSEIDALCEALEVRFLANRDPHLHFALLTDFADAPQEVMPNDEPLLRHAEACVRDLNTRHGAGATGPFHLLHRVRRWNDGEGCWMGWERKRGKLQELNALLLGDTTIAGFSTHVGEATALEGMRFVIVLDADTELPRGAARRMVGTFAHPLNRAELDPSTGAVVDGYTILQPRVEISPTSIDTSWFARLFCNDVGLDPYTHAVSDVYQDLLGQGVFVGKGIYDVAAFARSVRDRIPENTLLSHDLFEGIHGRAGLLSDVMLLEDYPAQYLAFTRRLHRWARGDWQLLPWLRRRVPLASGGRAINRLDLVGRWQVLDNLRRSVLLPTVLAFLIVAWMCFPRPLWLWTAVGLLVLAAPGLADIGARLIAWPWAEAPLVELAQILRAGRTAAAVWFFEIAFLAHQATVLVDAIARTCARVFVTHRHLLQWTAARQTARRLARNRSHWSVWREMAAAPALAVLTACGLALVRPMDLIVALPLLLLWFSSPELAIVMSRPSPPQLPTLEPADTALLRQLARRTWHFFETFTTPEEQWLPPDHFQEDPRGVVARRTSPTNIGFLLLSTLSAYDFGYRGSLWLALRLRNTLDTLDRMERYRGHFLNWYDTATLAPLQPKYVSAVDSGNLAASLVAVAEGCLEWTEAPAINAAEWDGFCDTLAVLDDVVTRAAPQCVAADVVALQTTIERLRKQACAARDQPAEWTACLADLLEHGCARLDEGLLRVLSQADGPEPLLASELRTWAVEIRRHAERMRRETDLFLAWLTPLRQPPSVLRQLATTELDAVATSMCSTLPAVPRLSDLPGLTEAAIDRLSALDTMIGTSVAAPDRTEASSWIQRVSESLAVAGQTAVYVLERLADVSARARRFADETDFAALYDEQRRLLHLGYDLTAARLDMHHYDLLASEARLASFLAIAKGDLPEEHWLNLGRPIGKVQGARTLLSWSGTMFEYLMPGVLLHEDPETLLGRSCRAAVREQIAYASQRGIPWGMSESGYYRVDAQQNYQYRAFGVSTLGFKRGLEDDLVVAPYAAVLALPYDPRATVDNLQRLQRMGARGMYGLYEAVDFTPQRLPGGGKHAIVRSFMAHHQGMILTTLANYLHNDVLVRRFHAAPMVKTAEPLLFERPARQAPIERTRPEAAARAPGGRRRRVSMPAWEPQPGATPEVHVLANGRYSVVVSDDGGTWSRWQHLMLTRQSTDATLSDSATRCYLRDLRDGRWWSLVGAPTSGDSGRRVVFHPHMVEMQAREHDITARTRLTVVPDADVEIRHVTLVNDGLRRRQIRITSYAEVVLDGATAYLRHPAFSKLFVECEYLPAHHALLFRRRPKVAEERPVYLLHMLVLPASGAKAAGWETARDAFLGRGGDASAPVTIREGRPHRSGPAGAALDPVMVLAADVELGPQRSRQLFFVTAVAASRADALELAARYRLATHLDWSFDVARDHVESELRASNLDGTQLPALERLLSLLLIPRHSGPDAAALLARNERGRSSLWRHGISGDLPILAVRVREAKSAALLHEILRAHAWWRRRGIAVDLALLNEQPSGYTATTDDRIFRAVRGADADSWLNRPSGVFLIRNDQLDEADRVALLCAARAVIDGDGDSLADQLARVPGEPSRLPPLVATAAPTHAALAITHPDELLLDNGLGGFTADGREYLIRLDPGAVTPAPWCNVIAGPQLGCVVSESGGGYTWATNSGENRLTSWSNDPVTDAPSETVYLRDEETGAVWSSTPLPSPGPGPYQIRHGAGYSDFLHQSHALEQRLRIFVVVDEPVKIVQLTLTNRSPRPRRVTATYYVEWLLGTTRDPHQQFLIPEFDAESQTLLARNPWNEDFAARVAFVGANRRLHGFTADRAEFFGRGGSRAMPAALRRLGLAGVARPGLDPCAALQLHVDLAPGQTHTLHFVVGQAENRDAALALVRRFRESSAIDTAWAAVNAHWDALLGSVTVETPDVALNVMLNRWLLYQAISSRLWARTGFYQSSGAYGFRDQLQDVAALVHAAPALCREHILEAAAHQFVEGDVLHWWHPPAGAGIRTRCSDDLLWLPFITAQYVEATGDAGILDEDIRYLSAEPLRAGEDERYGRFSAGVERGALYDHCLRAIDRGDTVGRHGLPLFGSGDWNDGMNRVGHRGQGESVWLAQFLYATLLRMAPLCRQRGDAARADDLLRRAQRVRERLEAKAWDGGWYRRGYYDDGSPLGSAERDACRIDSLTQSWAVISGAGDSARSRRAVHAALDQLVREADGLVLLFTPPFDRSAQTPGYIKAYPPGIRENGGQYTHAAVWLAWALAELGDGDLATRLLSMLLPTQHTQTPEGVARYRVEPYVIAADVYSVFPHSGRGGWTWYTGSAAWAYRLGVEMILGLQRRDGGWLIDPCIPSGWSRFAVTLRDGATVYEIEVENPRAVNGGVEEVTLDAAVLRDNRLPRLQDGRVHRVHIRLGARLARHEALTSDAEPCGV